jgi:hypothetical protein
MQFSTQSKSRPTSEFLNFSAEQPQFEPNVIGNEPDDQQSIETSKRSSSKVKRKINFVSTEPIQSQFKNYRLQQVLVEEFVNLVDSKKIFTSPSL